MNKTIRVLAVLAVAQLILMTVIWSGESDLINQGENNILLAFNKAEIDHVLIKDGENEVNLTNNAGKWQTGDDFPADQNKVDKLLSTLETLKVGLPVTTSRGALQRFKVDVDDYERYVQLQKDGNTVAELYLGAGAGARQSHVRNGEQDTIYTVAIGSYDAPSKKEDWQDKSILELDNKNVKGIELAGLKLQLNNTTDNKDVAIQWEAKSLAEDKLVNQNAINESLPKLLALSIDNVLGKEIKPEYGLETPLLEIKLVFTGGERQYQFGKLKDEDSYVLKVSDRDEYFKIASFIGKPVIEEISSEKWLTEKPQTEKKDKQEIDPVN